MSAIDANKAQLTAIITKVYLSMGEIYGIQWPEDGKEDLLIHDVRGRRQIAISREGEVRITERYGHPPWCGILGYGCTCGFSSQVAPESEGAERRDRR